MFSSIFSCKDKIGRFPGQVRMEAKTGSAFFAPEERSVKIP